MKKKLIREIDRCVFCSYCKGKWEHWCEYPGLNERQINDDDLSDFPNWCPLEDADGDELNVSS